MIKAIVFDVGGVVFTTNWGAVKKDMLKKYKFSIFLYSDYPKKIQNKFKGLSIGKKSFKEVIRELSGKKNIIKIVKDYKASYCKNQKINKPLIRLLRKLKKDYELFYLSNTNDLHLEANRENRLFEHFKKGYGSCEIGLKKPDKRAIFYILKKYSLNLKEVIFVDDKKENTVSARKLGIKTILFKNNKQLVRNLRKLGVKI